ncbi:hypothetical protein I5L56_09825 [Pseudomonas oryzihabitans]|uniref:hypothetical protein n=1 Tax=Pseudomonas oryzihabitans TaxID=47885 RepID=UPI0018D9A173|nr:hypothetical protein [Pseudomonas oryzihabitans]MBH3329921.1 hypothetical protein [Pseudomonas oryzihabitans]
MNAQAQARAESRRRLDAARAEVNAELSQSLRFRKRQKNPFWILLPVIGGIAIAALMACWAQLTV